MFKESFVDIVAVALQLIIALGIANVWILRADRANDLPQFVTDKHNNGA